MDIVDYTKDVKENDKRLQTMVEYAKQKQKDIVVGEDVLEKMMCWRR